MTSTMQRINAHNRVVEFAKNIRASLGGSPRSTTVAALAASIFDDTSSKPVVTVVYHSTEVVTVHLDDKQRPVKIVLNSGGWHTATTRSRMNAVLSELLRGLPMYCGVSLDKGEMEFFVRTWHDTVIPALIEGRTEMRETRVYSHSMAPFVDGLTIHLYKNGKIRSVTDANGKRLMSVHSRKAA